MLRIKKYLLTRGVCLLGVSVIEVLLYIDFLPEKYFRPFEKSDQHESNPQELKLN